MKNRNNNVSKTPQGIAHPAATIPCNSVRPNRQGGDRANLRRRRMKLLLDTHLLLWAAGEPQRLSKQARTLIDNPENEPLFSAASLWEVAIKRGLGREDFKVDARLLRRGLLDNGYGELPIVSDHVVATESLPPIHKDPFDRVLVAQATVEGITLLTIDSLVSQYPGPIRMV